MVTVYLLPELDPINEPFWKSGADGVLRFQRCQDCGWWVHPPRPRCPKCMTTNLAYEPVSGNATVYSFTVNHQKWTPDLEVPYAIAIVEFPEQADMRMTTRLVDVDIESVVCGMPVHVVFEAVEDAGIFMPYFTAVA